jgi:hypothetical protein
MGMTAEPYSREGDADEILARYAHELAEKIRSKAYDDHKNDPTLESTEWGYLGAADLIDPEVQE